MKLLKRIKWRLVIGYVYLYYALYNLGLANNWFELAKACVILPIAILTFWIVSEPTD